MTQLSSTLLRSNVFDHDRYERHAGYDLHVKGVGEVSATMTLRFEPPQLEVSFDEPSGLSTVDLTKRYVKEGELELKGKGPIYNRLSDVFFDRGKSRKALSFAVGSALREMMAIS